MADEPNDPSDVVSRYLASHDPAATGGGGGTATYTAPSNAWYQEFFGNYGLPSNVQSQIVSILTQYASDPTTAVALAQQYLRTTPWYQQTFPGFNQGVANGLFTDETGYRSYLNNVNQFYNQYLGRHVSANEIQGYIGAGYSPDYINKLLAGSAWSQANAGDVQPTMAAFGDGSNSQLSGQDLRTLGNEQAGIDTTRGMMLENMLKRAQTRMAGVFQGVLARPSLSLGPSGISAPGLAGGKQAPDVAA